MADNRKEVVDDAYYENAMEDLKELIQGGGLAANFHRHGHRIRAVLDVDDNLEAVSVVESLVHSMPADKYTIATRFALDVLNNEEMKFRSDVAWSDDRPEWWDQNSDQWEAFQDSLTYRRWVLSRRDGFQVSEATLRRWEKVGLETLARRIAEFGEKSRHTPKEPLDAAAELRELRRELKELRALVENYYIVANRARWGDVEWDESRGTSAAPSVKPPPEQD